VNLSKFGVAATVTGMLFGTTIACTSTVRGHPITQHDKLSDWVVTNEEHVVAEGWRLGPTNVLEVKPEYQNKFIGVGVIGDHDQCLVLFWNYDEHMKMFAKAFTRYDDAFVQSTEWPLDRIRLGSWVIEQRSICNTEHP
jgi:hypothetical protein